MLNRYLLILLALFVLNDSSPQPTAAVDPELSQFGNLSSSDDTIFDQPRGDSDDFHTTTTTTLSSETSQLLISHFENISSIKNPATSKQKIRAPPSLT